MIKTLTVKNRRGDMLGKIVFSNKGFEVKISSPEDRKKIEKIIKDSLEKGISVLGMAGIELSEPLTLGAPLFFDALEDLLTKRGYVVTEKLKKL